MASPDRSVKILSGGAAQGLVAMLRGRFEDAGGPAIEGTFGAVGAMRDKLLAGEPCDVLIVTQALVDELTSQGHLLPGTAVPLGTVMTGVAVKQGRPHPECGTREGLSAALEAASGIYFPDPVKATAGIHFMKVLTKLGLETLPASTLRTFPNGATAMREMAAAKEQDVIGCTQVTEILSAPGVELAGLLPKEFELATVYTAAMTSRVRSRADAVALIQLLAGPQSAAQRQAAGFMPASR